MQLPILSYGQEMLQQQCRQVENNYPDLNMLIGDMWETLYAADGCGLAAVQVAQPLCLFLVDSKMAYNSMHPDSRAVYFDDNNGIKQEFINARITGCSRRTWKQEEGCLSLPGIPAEIERPWTITIDYLDRNFNPHTETYSGITARMIQHEYDHTRGVLHIDLLAGSKKKQLRARLERLAKGIAKTAYPMSFLAKQRIVRK